jgi:8-oxo-dGTP pyrophosphatase MutT (NUDIX family)
MRNLYTVFRGESVPQSGSFYKREACRAIVREDDLFLFIRSKKYGECKFPGGGLEQGESHETCIAREMKEETGRSLVGTPIEYGKVLELGKDLRVDTDLWLQESYYYICKASVSAIEPVYDGYEIEYGYYPVWLTIEEAIEINHSVPDHENIPWKMRDTIVMERLKKEKDFHAY